MKLIVLIAGLVLIAISFAVLAYKSLQPERECRPVFVVMSEETFL